MIRFALVVASTLGFLLTAALGNMIVPLRRAFRQQDGERQQPEPEAETNPQPPQDEPPPAVPALGGVCVMAAVLAAAGMGWTAACIAENALLGSQFTTRLVAALGGALAFGAVGAADDIARIKRRAPLGLRRGVRIALEAGVSALVLIFLYFNDWLTTGLSLPWAGYVELGAAAPVLWWGGLIALTECGRTADGADGTVCGTAFVAMLGAMFALTALGWFPLAVLPAAMAGALIALLLWDFPPTKLRPGTAGCMFAAGAIGCLPLCIGWPELTLPLGLPFWLEGGMVALQIVCTRLRRGKPLFSTAPLHRWLEKRGLSPVGVFYAMCAAALAGFAMAALFALQ